MNEQEIIKNYGDLIPIDFEKFRIENKTLL